MWRRAWPSPRVLLKCLYRVRIFPSYIAAHQSLKYHSQHHLAKHMSWLHTPPLLPALSVLSTASIVELCYWADGTSCGCTHRLLNLLAELQVSQACAMDEKQGV